MTEAARGRHRATHRTGTSITVAARSAGKKATALGRGSALLVASSSLVVGSVMIPTASAQDLDNEANSITAEEGDNAVVSSVVVSEAVVWSDDSTSLKVKRATKPKVKETATSATTAAEPTEDSTPARSAKSSRSASRNSLVSGDEDKTAKVGDSSDSSGDSAKDSDKKSKSADDAIDGDDLESRGAAVIEVAKRYIGVPYRYGGSTPKGFDCSGFTSYVFAKFGIDLPRTSGAQRYAGKVVSAKDAVPGDIVWSPGHVAIYIGNGKIIDAPRPGKSVAVRSMYQSNPVFIRVL
ncbi:hypothetical protein GCM10010401_05240 [Rarobacter faecitabidus]|uniref:Cell wall-associated NlpC family hydrolase n=1 Tax=Rarobacter faecitabidus TaxID=13243 RepID=A0A542ZTP3_RARFA|nr:C40 family peptidase [Rarobacter faecitabidus]TQL63725.1 cell wall-associated NlpC family hydrolase [Rarobacter faecitabidus]